MAFPAYIYSERMSAGRNVPPITRSMLLHINSLGESYINMKHYFEKKQFKTLN